MNAEGKLSFPPGAFRRAVSARAGTIPSETRVSPRLIGGDLPAGRQARHKGDKMKKKVKYVLLGLLIVFITTLLIVYNFKHIDKTEINLSQQTAVDQPADDEKAIKTPKINPKDNNSHVILGEDYINKAKYSEAEKELRIALKADPDNSWVLKVIGNLYFRQKKYDEAERYYIKALKSDKIKINKAWIYHDWALLYLAINNKKKAFDSEKIALSYLPEDKVIKDEYDRIKSLCGK